MVVATGALAPVGTALTGRGHEVSSRYDQSPSGADVLDEPVVVVRAVGTTVVPRAHSRGPRGQG